MGPLGPQRQLRSAMEPVSKSKEIQFSKTVQQKKKYSRADSSNFDEQMSEHVDLHINYTSLCVHPQDPMQENGEQTYRSAKMNKIGQRDFL